MMRTITVSFILLFILLVCCASLVAERSIAVFQSRLLSDDNQLIASATVSLFSDSKKISTTLSNEDGIFSFSETDLQKELQILITALGYEDKILKVNEIDSVIILHKRIIELSPITVSTENRSTSLSRKTEKSKLKKRSSASLVSNNPISGIRQPQLLKQGSSHSSKIRINGSSPAYYLDGNPIGDDPNHYGIFSIVPSSIVGDVQFYPSGTPVEYQSPTVLNLEARVNFKHHDSRELELSAVQATSTISIGREDYFITGALRKSLLDKIIKVVNYQTDRRTIPPTNFQDVAISSGVKLSEETILYVSHLNSYDFLEYKTESTEQNLNGLSTFQHRDYNFTGARFSINEANRLYTIELSRKSRLEKYKATPSSSINNGLDICLTEQQYKYNAKFDLAIFKKQYDIKSGLTFSYTPQRNTYLNQTNWNFLSPDASSNSPFIYQHEINVLYDTLSLNSREFNSAVFTSIRYYYNNFQIENGLRYDRFSNLSNSGDFNFRIHLLYMFGKQDKLSFYYGTFSESPVENVLENYQVLIRDNAFSLTPIHTKIYSVTYFRDNFKLSAFRKKVSELPERLFNLSEVEAIGVVSDEFLTMSSSADLSFTGFDLSYANSNLFNSKIDFYSFYGYTHANKSNSYGMTNYELNAPHKLYAELFYKLSTRMTLGTEISYRSGYAYTPHLNGSTSLRTNRYSKEYISSVASNENSERFPDNYTVNLSGRYRAGQFEFFFSLSNITNRENPIVAASDGFVYDAGIMPGIGFNWKW